MERICDVCGAQVAADQRYCPGCGLEWVEPESEQAATTGTRADPWQWEPEAAPGAEAAAKDYVLKEAGPDVALAREKLQRAHELLKEGRLRQGGELLRAVREQLGGDPKGQQIFRRLARYLKKVKADVIHQAEDLLDDPRRLHRYLTGPAADQLNREEICRLALESIERRYRHDAESVHDLLRLTAFRHISDKQIRSEHQRLENIVWRKKRRQHFFTSAGVFAVVIAVAIPGLFIWVLFLLQLPFLLKLMISAAALATLLWGLEPLRKWITVMVEGEEGDEDEDEE